MMIEADQAGLSTGGRQRASIAGGRPPVDKPGNNRKLACLIILPREKFKDFMWLNLLIQFIFNALQKCQVFTLPTHFPDEPLL